MQSDIKQRLQEGLGLMFVLIGLGVAFGIMKHGLCVFDCTIVYQVTP